MRRDLPLTGLVAVLLLSATPALSHVFLTRGWMPLTFAALGAALAVAALARRAGLGWFAAFIATAAVWVAFTYVVHLEGAGLLPGREQLREYLALWSQGITDMLQEPSPARPLPGLMVLVTAGAWLAAHLTHELIVRARLAGVGLIPPAVLWAVPLIAPQSPGRTWTYTLPFLAMCGLVLLTQPDADLAGWRRPAASLNRPTRAGMALGASALVVATLVPGLLPQYGAEAWVDLSGVNAARGYQPIVDVTRRLRLPDPRDLLLVRSDRPVYLRLAGLDTFDGGTWRLGPPTASSFSPDDVVPADRRLTPEAEMRSSTELLVDIENLSLENIFVPAPYHPIEVGGAAAERMVYAREGAFIATSDVLEDEPALLPGLAYTVRAQLPTPTPAELEALTHDVYAGVEFQRWLTLPGEYAELRQIADGIVADAGAQTPYAAAFALQDFFRGGDRFEYSTAVDPLRDASELTRFVAEARTGYCEYFATAMAVMLRLEGIPARVAVGFRLGRVVGEGQYIVSTEDAHAWVEVLFPGYGWIQFEPTPALGDALVPSREDITPDAPLTAEPSPGATVLPSQAPSGNPTADIPSFNPQAQNQPTPGSAGTGADGGLPAWPLIVAGVLGLGAVATVAADRRRRRPRPDLPDDERVLEVQRRVLRTGRRLGVPRRPAETAADVAQRWSNEGRIDPAPAQRFAQLSQAAAFGGHLPPEAGSEAERLGDVLVAGLRGSLSRRTRLTRPVSGPVDATLRRARRTVSARRAPRR